MFLWTEAVDVNCHIYGNIGRAGLETTFVFSFLPKYLHVMDVLVITDTFIYALDTRTCPYRWKALKLQTFKI